MSSAEQVVSARSFTDGRNACISTAAVQELIARAVARLPAGRHPADAERRAAIAVAYAVAETASASELTAGRPLAAVEVPEDAHDLARRTGLSDRDVRGGLALLIDSGALERVVGRAGGRLRLVDEALGDSPVLARVDWARLRDVLGETGASVAPTLAVARVLASLTPRLREDGGGETVSCTQQELVDASLFGRTAVVAALRALVGAGALEHAARRGTWTECRLLPPVFGVRPFSPTRPTDHPVRSADHEPRTRDGAGHRDPASTVSDETTLRAATASRVEPPRPVETPGAHAMILDFGGVRVPVLPGTQVEPPPGAKLVIEVDAEGRRYLCIGDGVRLGPLQ